MFNVASVSYFNSRPLIEGLDRDPRIALSLDVPARLIDGLLDERYDVALLPTIDYQRMDGLRIIPVGGIGSDGPTLTVRIFSKTPVGQIRTLACDPDSHTSVALARVVLVELYRARGLELRPVERAGDSDALLLIGDKVICDAPTGYAHELDLGQAWKELTGLPFVFAVWTARRDAALGGLPDRLRQALQMGRQRTDDLVQQYAVPRGWPVDVARDYLTKYLTFDVGPRQLQAIELFHRKAAEHGIIPGPPRPLHLVR
jgi:chorismate dehydratase